VNGGWLLQPPSGVNGNWLLHPPSGASLMNVIRKHSETSVKKYLDSSPIVCSQRHPAMGSDEEKLSMPSTLKAHSFKFSFLMILKMKIYREVEESFED
jgi:hypothetical protein